MHFSRCGGALFCGSLLEKFVRMNMSNLLVWETLSSEMLRRIEYLFWGLAAPDRDGLYGSWAAR